MKKYIVKRTNTKFNRVHYAVKVDSVMKRLVVTENVENATVFSTKKEAKEIISNVSKNNIGYYDKFEIVEVK